LVYSLERNWAFVREIGSEGKGAGPFTSPMGMCIYRDRLIVCDENNRRLQFIDISAADAKDWRFDAPFGSQGTAKGRFERPMDVCTAIDVLFVAEHRNNRVQTFTIAVNAATGALTLTYRSIIGGFDRPHALVCAPDASRVFVGDYKQISCIDVMSGAVRPFATIADADSLCLADGLLYAVHSDCLSVVNAETGAIQQSAVKTLHGRSWKAPLGIAVLPDFFLISDDHSHCVHVIPRTS
jgi:hypothetical protein